MSAVLELPPAGEPEAAETARPRPTRNPSPPAPTRVPLGQRAITLALVVGPLAALGLAIVRFWGHGVSARDLVLAVGLYAVTGFGISVGYHRLFAHGSFKANAPLKVGLAVAGSLAVQGGVIGWVANHRRHHTFTDREGDPHTPWLRGTGVRARLRGLYHAHVGWFFRPSTTDPDRYARDLLADRQLLVVDRLFPLWLGLSLTAPFALGWWWGGGPGAAATALLWAGGVRIALLHHVTWSINSVCHMFGRQSFETGEQSRNVAWLAVASMGESWHNSHHAFPAMARFGTDRHQWDSAAALIRLFERAGWAHHVRWPDPDRLDRKRRAPR